MGSSSSAELHQADVMVCDLWCYITQDVASAEKCPIPNPGFNPTSRHLINWPGFDMLILLCIGVNCVCMAMQDPTLDEADLVS